LVIRILERGGELKEKQVLFMEGLITDTDKALIPFKGIPIEQLANKTSSLTVT
jgi:hypothetical protein